MRQGVVVDDGAFVVQGHELADGAGGRVGRCQVVDVVDDRHRVHVQPSRARALPESCRATSAGERPAARRRGRTTAWDVSVARASEPRELTLEADVVAVHQLAAEAVGDQLEQGRDALVVRGHAVCAVDVLVAPEVEGDRCAAFEKRAVVAEACRDLRVEVAEHRLREVAACSLDDVEGVVTMACERVEVDVQGNAREHRLGLRRAGQCGSLDGQYRVRGADLADHGRARRVGAELRQQGVAVVLGGPARVVSWPRLGDVGAAAHHDVETARTGDHGEPGRIAHRPSRASRRSPASSRGPAGARARRSP